MGIVPFTGSWVDLAILSSKAWSRTAFNSPAAVEIELVDWEALPTEGLTATWPMVDWLTTQVAVVWRLTAVVAVVERWLTVVVAWVLSWHTVVVAVVDGWLTVVVAIVVGWLTARVARRSQGCAAG